MLEVKYTFPQAEQTCPKNTSAIIAFHARCAAMIDVMSVYAREILKPLPNLILDLSKTNSVSNKSYYPTQTDNLLKTCSHREPLRLTFVIIRLRYIKFVKRFIMDQKGFDNAEGTLSC